MSRIYCSRCGRAQALSPFSLSVDEVVDAGWRSVGSAIYCPFCAHTSKRVNNKKTTRSKLGTAYIMGNLKEGF